ncbi:polynucleotide adenylyltransferase PcnB [Candidatus Spongiihabitans sp.]|uniref:polynucleotide adenylyltransferase PcnB n=1 Tax=Candidatus Spongiihabitans sp. TaxID=3101308 RepID=UPI003C7E3CB8
MKPTQHSAVELGFDKSCVSRNAIKVVQGLQSSGFDGYLVGGCVRDLLMGRKPKDFDVTTNANPEQIKKIFDRARIIGRRFKIVHVTFGRGREREIIEVATYRAMPGSANKKGFRGAPKASSSGRILDDNVYGTIEVDAIRRDFTINALYYDPKRERVIDFVSGIEDAKTKTLRIIGDINTRFSEDPVRMMRVVRFQAKLGLRVSETIFSAIEKNAALLKDVPAARLFEEVLKLFHHCAAAKTWLRLRETLLLYYLFPQTVKCINQAGGDQFESLILSALNNTDERVGQNKPVIPAYLFAVMLWRPFQIECNKLVANGVRRNEAFWIASDLVFKRQSSSVTMPLRVKGPAHEIWAMQSLLENRIPRSIERLLENRRFRAAYDFLLLRQEIGEVSKDIADWWSEIQDRDVHHRQAMIETMLEQGRGNSNPKRRSKHAENKTTPKARNPTGKHNG